jgi:hypothetical protein
MGIIPIVDGSVNVVVSVVVVVDGVVVGKVVDVA